MPIGNDKPRIVKIRFHPSVVNENRQYPEAVADAMAFLNRIRGRTKTEIDAILEPRSERKVFQREMRLPQGALRLIFYWGGGGVLWYLGAFVKGNNLQGERLAKPILRRRFDIDELETRKLK
jgi:hypothetical protein